MEGEETLDAQWASGIAPDAKARIYTSGSLSFVDLDLALDQIIADLASEPGMRQLSISLGLGETFMGSADGEWQPRTRSS
jgi:kumamolisin